MTGALAPIISAARDYAGRGWSVIPVKAYKTPAVAAWKGRQTVQTDPEEIGAWFSRATNVAGVGIVLGAVSGDLFARDFDKPDSYTRWAAAQPALAASLPTV